jgi:hypothetical protein
MLMTILTQSRPVTPTTRHSAKNHMFLRVVAAGLALGVAYIHVRDQGGFPGDKSPAYIALGYYLLEAAGVGTAIALLLAPIRHLRSVWALAVGVALGPLVGYVLSRGPGLPLYTEDRGNWTEMLGIVSVAVEAALLVLATVMLRPSRRATR